MSDADDRLERAAKYLWDNIGIFRRWDQASAEEKKRWLNFAAVTHRIMSEGATKS